VKSKNFRLFFGKFDCLESVLGFFLKQTKKKKKRKRRRRKRKEEEEDTFTWKYFKD
jgi:hypothetical protein